MGAQEAEWEIWALGSRWVGLEGPGWLGAWAAGGAGCWLPPPRRAVGPVVPPSPSGLLERGTGRPLSLLPPSSHLFGHRSGSAQCRGREEAGDLRGSPPGKEHRRWGPRRIRRGRHFELRVLDPGLRSLGRSCFTGGSGSNCGAPGRKALLVPRGWGRWGPLEAIQETGEGCRKISGMTQETKGRLNVRRPSTGSTGTPDSNSFPTSRCVCHLRIGEPRPNRERVPRKSTPSECSEPVSEPLGSAPWAL